MIKTQEVLKLAQDLDTWDEPRWMNSSQAIVSEQYVNAVKAVARAAAKALESPVQEMTNADRHEQNVQKFFSATAPSPGVGSVPGEMLAAYCTAWEKSFLADNPYHSISMSLQDRKHIGAGLENLISRIADLEGSKSEWLDSACALIKAADDAAADRDYMLDSNDCIRVLRGEWTGGMLNDCPPTPQSSIVQLDDSVTAQPVKWVVPSVWVSVDERLPVVGGYYLVTVDTDDGPHVDVLLFSAKEQHWIHEGEPTFSHSYWFSPTHWADRPEAAHITREKP